MRTERDLGAGRRCAPPETLACEGDRRASVSPRLDSLRYGVPGEIARAVPVVKPRELAGFAVLAPRLRSWTMRRAMVVHG